MELLKLSKEEIKDLDLTKSREMETEIRRQLVGMRMAVYTEEKREVAVKRALRRQLARVLTFRRAKEIIGAR